MIRALASGRRLTALLFTLGIQGLVAALLLFSLTVARHILPAQETILLLPRPAQQPVVIDARAPPKPRPSSDRAPAEPAPPPLPAYAAPSAGLSASRGGNSALLGALGRHVENCRIEKRDAEASCPNLAQQDERAMLPEERKVVKNAPVWQAEVDRRNAPLTLPGAALGPLGVLVTALTNPGAFSDPRAYSAVPARQPMSGAERLQLRRYENPETTRGGTDFENRVRRDGAAASRY
jgi:hypothetical protein